MKHRVGVTRAPNDSWPWSKDYDAMRIGNFDCAEALEIEFESYSSPEMHARFHTIRVYSLGSCPLARGGHLRCLELVHSYVASTLAAQSSEMLLASLRKRWGCQSRRENLSVASLWSKLCFRASSRLDVAAGDCFFGPSTAWGSLEHVGKSWDMFHDLKSLPHPLEQGLLYKWPWFALLGLACVYKTRSGRRRRLHGDCIGGNWVLCCEFENLTGWAR